MYNHQPHVELTDENGKPLSVAVASFSFETAKEMQVKTFGSFMPDVKIPPTTRFEMWVVPTSADLFSAMHSIPPRVTITTINNGHKTIYKNCAVADVSYDMNSAASLNSFSMRLITQEAPILEEPAVIVDGKGYAKLEDAVGPLSSVTCIPVAKVPEITRDENGQYHFGPQEFHQMTEEEIEDEENPPEFEWFEDDSPL